MSTYTKLYKHRLLVLLITASLFPVSAFADKKYDELKEQVEMLQKQLSQVQSVLKEYEKQSEDNSNEVKELKKEISETTNVAKIENEIAAASEWRDPNTLIHMSGYANIGYSSDSESFNVGTFAPIFHYQYRDLVMLEAELELEVDSVGETELALEYLTIDLFLSDNITFVGGKFLSPIGQFRQNLHPSWINKIVSAPPGFGHDGAAPTSEMGFQFRGGFELGKMNTNYAFYVSNGPELIAVEEDSEIELEGVIAEGLGNDVDNKKTFGGRIGFLPTSNLEIGFSAATGKATVTKLESEEEHGALNTFSDLLVGVKDESETPDLHDEQARDYDVLGFDFAYRLKNFQLRGEYVKTKIGEATSGETASEGASWESWYTQASYLIPKTKWEPVIRYTDFTAPHSSVSQEQFALGINYQFTSSVIAKATYEFNDGLSGSKTDENRWLLQLAYGF
jgi:hypothetical protein